MKEIAQKFSENIYTRHELYKVRNKLMEERGLKRNRMKKPSAKNDGAVENKKNRSVEDENKRKHVDDEKIGSPMKVKRTRMNEKRELSSLLKKQINLKKLRNSKNHLHAEHLHR